MNRNEMTLNSFYGTTKMLCSSCLLAYAAIIVIMTNGSSNIESLYSTPFWIEDWIGLLNSNEAKKFVHDPPIN